VLRDPRFADASPAEVWAVLLDEGVYLCSQRTMYRLLAERGETGDRRAQATHPPGVKPKLVAHTPNEVWTRDIPEYIRQHRGPRTWCRDFFDHYNNHHRHSGIGLLAPNDRALRPDRKPSTPSAPTSWPPPTPPDPKASAAYPRCHPTLPKRVWINQHPHNPSRRQNQRLGNPYKILSRSG